MELIKDFFFDVDKERKKIEDKGNKIKALEGSPIDKARDLLLSEIQRTTSRERLELYNKELNALSQLTSSYEYFKKTELTDKTKRKLETFFSALHEDTDIITDKTSIERTLREESNMLADNIFGDKSIRDNVEKNISFGKNIINSTFYESPEMETFLNTFSIKYKNYLDEFHTDTSIDIENEALFLTLDELGVILREIMLETLYDFEITFTLKDGITKTLKTIDYIPSDKKIKSIRSIKSIGGEQPKDNKEQPKNNKEQPKDNKEELKDSKKLKEIKKIKKIKKSKEQINKENTIVRMVAKYKTELLALGFNLDGIDDRNQEALDNFPEQVLEYQIKKGIVEGPYSPGAGNLGPFTRKNIELSCVLKKQGEKDIKGNVSKKLLEEEDDSTFLLGEFLKENGLPESTKVLLGKLIYQFFKGETAYQVELKDTSPKNYKFTDTFIKENKEAFYKNFIVFLNVLFGIESAGGKKYIKNTDLEGWEKGSTAKGFFQYLHGYKGNKKSIDNNREKGMHSSWQVALRDNNKFYTDLGVNSNNLSNFNDSKIPEYIKIAYENDKHISPLDMTTEQSLNIFVINLFYRTSVKSQETQLMASLLGNDFGTRSIYTNVHHTSPGTDTKEVTDNYISKFPELVASIKK